MDRRVDGTWAWVVAGAAFVLLFLAYGSAYTFGVFMPALVAEFGADRARGALAFSVLASVYPMIAVLSGPAADRFGTRRVCGLGMLVMAAGLVYASRASALWQVYLGFGVGVAVGIGFTFAPANAGLQRWLTRRRGLASGLASSGIGVSVMVLPPLVAAWMQWRDWRAAMLGLGVLALLTGTVAAALMGDPPASRTELASAAEESRRFDVRGALTSRGFVMFYLSSMLCCLALFVPFVHLVTYCVDRGLGEATGLYLLGAIGLGSVVGRLALTSMSDRLGRRGSMVAIYAGIGVGFALWYVDGSVATLTLFATVFGICYGGYVSLIAPILAEYFGIARIGTVLGGFMSSVSAGGFLGPWLAGHAFDLWGSYRVPILVCAAVSVLAAACALGMPARPYPGAAFVRRESAGRG